MHGWFLYNVFGPVCNLEIQKDLTIGQVYTLDIIAATPHFVKVRSDFTFRTLHVSEDPGTSRKIHTSPETGHLH